MLSSLLAHTKNGKPKIRYQDFSRFRLAVKNDDVQVPRGLFACATCAIGDDEPLRAIVDDGMPIVFG
jgi:hypothetical protein